MRINHKIKGKDNFKSIGILDIFGFENFEVKAYSLNLSFIQQKKTSKSSFKDPENSFYALLLTKSKEILHEHEMSLQT